MGQEELDYEFDKTGGNVSPPVPTTDSLVSLSHINNGVATQGGCASKSSSCFFVTWPYNDDLRRVQSDEERTTECDDVMMDDSALECDGVNEMQLLVQAQMLLAKNVLYQKIDVARRQLTDFHSSVFDALPRATTDDSVVTATHRDAMVASLRFLNIFCNCSPETFALSVSLLDRLVGGVKVHRTYLSCIGTCCFYIASMARETVSRHPDPCELLKLSRCGGSIADLCNTERLICEALKGRVTDVTSLSLLELFYEVFELSAGARCEGAFSEESFASLVSKLEVLMCRFEFTKYRGDTLALALLSYDLQERGVLNNPDQFALVVELQYFCQMSDVEFIECRAEIIEYLTLYRRQPTRLPQSQLCWTISRRTLHKMRPSTRAVQDLEPIMEDEPRREEEEGEDGEEMAVEESHDDDDEDDEGLFDSENEDVDLATDISHSFISSSSSFPAITATSPSLSMKPSSLSSCTLFQSEEEEEEDEAYGSDEMEKDNKPSSLDMVAKDKPITLDTVVKDKPVVMNTVVMDKPASLDTIVSDKPTSMDKVVKDIPDTLDMVVKDKPIIMEMVVKDKPITLDMVVKDKPITLETVVIEIVEISPGGEGCPIEA